MSKTPKGGRVIATFQTNNEKMAKNLGGRNVKKIGQDKNNGLPKLVKSYLPEEKKTE